MVEIVLLAMVALFVGLRLYAVLGRRTGHEQQPVTRPDTMRRPVDAAVPAADAAGQDGDAGQNVFQDSAAAGIRQIVSADPSFDVARFLDGAQAAYRMVLEAFWKGDREEIAYLTADEVRASLDGAIVEREAAGYRLDNRLIRIDRAVIEEAFVSGRDAVIRVRFDADIAAVTRDAEGNVIAGSLTDAVDTHDLWTFRRTLGSQDPNWLLVETDEIE